MVNDDVPMAEASVFSDLFAVGDSEAGPSGLTVSTPMLINSSTIAPEIDGVAEQLINGMGEINIAEDISGAEGSSGGKGKEVVKPADYVFK